MREWAHINRTSLAKAALHFIELGLRRDHRKTCLAAALEVCLYLAETEAEPRPLEAFLADKDVQPPLRLEEYQEYPDLLEKICALRPPIEQEVSWIPRNTR